MSFALCNLSTLARRRSGTFSLHDAIQTKTFYLKARPFHEVDDDWVNTSFKDTTQTFWGEGQYFDRFAIDQWISIFSAFNTGTMGEKAIRELYRYGVTGCVPAGHCTDTTTHTHTPTVAVARGLCGGERSEAKKKLHCR